MYTKQYQFKHFYHLVTPSPWPVFLSVNLLALTISAIMYMHSYTFGGLLLIASLGSTGLIVWNWFGDIIFEATYEGAHTLKVQQGLRLGMILFIISEIMFFFAWFWAFFHSSLAPAIQIGAIWPPSGILAPKYWELPLVNTLILLLSGVWATLAHHCIKFKTDRYFTFIKISFLWSIGLGVLFTVSQVYEYIIGDFTIADGIYGSVFYMATGFHGMHVIMGTIFLFVTMIRHLRGHFLGRHYFGVDASAWYWHFVDIIWLFLFVSIYWWGGALDQEIVVDDIKELGLWKAAIFFRGRSLLGLTDFDVKEFRDRKKPAKSFMAPLNQVKCTSIHSERFKMNFNILRLFVLQNEVISNIFETFSVRVGEVFQKADFGIFHLDVSRIIYIVPLVILMLLILSISYLTLLERKIMAAIQRRKGPDVVGVWGLLQPLADGLKLILKELTYKTTGYHSLSGIYLCAAGGVFFFSVLGWIVIPFSINAFVLNSTLSLLFNFMAASLGIYAMISSGWASRSRYACFGGIRATAQMISYELVLGTVNLIIVLLAGSYNYQDIVLKQLNQWNITLLFPVFIIYLILILIETNRTPFDLAEAEAELVAGYNVEYSSILFALSFLGEYSNILLLSIIRTIYSLGGWGFGISIIDYFGFCCKILMIVFFFILVRSVLPRYRYDELLLIGWQDFLPISFSLFIATAGFRVGVCASGV